MKTEWAASKMLQSGVILTAAGYLTLIIGFGFQIGVRRHLQGQVGEFGFVQAAIAFIGFLGLPLTIATQAVTHYIARFHFNNESERLHGLLMGCRKFLLHMTILGSVAAIVFVKPLGDFFHIPRVSLTIVALVCVLAGFWSSFVTALCQGMGWFKRLALIGLLAAVIRCAFGISATGFSPIAEWAVLASTVMLLANLVLLFWAKDFPHQAGRSPSPWSKEMIHFLVVSTAWAVGSNCFSQYDMLVAQRYFPHVDLDNYAAAALLARQIPALVGPMLTVLFIHRSSRLHHPNDAGDLLKLLGLYAVGLVINGVGLYALRGVGLWLIGQNTPEAATMIAPLALTMIFYGLMQAIGTWALASHWTGIALLYGLLGGGYWMVILKVGRTPAALLWAMPVTAGIAFVTLFVFWFMALHRHKLPIKAATAG